jgi:SAM-dependent methyltransferase
VTELYDGWASFYDTLLGATGFDHIWPAFHRAFRRFDMHITSAADFGCGTGLFLARLARTVRHATLFGVDRSSAMLRLATRRLAGSQVELFQGDLRNFKIPNRSDLRNLKIPSRDLRNLKIPTRVDLVTCNFATINYMNGSLDLSAALRNLACHLHLHGYLIMDFLCTGIRATNHNFVQKIWLPGIVANWHIQSLGGNKGGRVLMRNCRREAQSWHCWHETHDQRWWPLRYMLDRLRNAGLAPVAIAPLGGVRPSQGGRWVQVVARRT